MCCNVGTWMYTHDQNSMHRRSAERPYRHHHATTTALHRTPIGPNNTAAAAKQGCAVPYRTPRRPHRTARGCRHRSLRLGTECRCCFASTWRLSLPCACSSCGATVWQGNAGQGGPWWAPRTGRWCGEGKKGLGFSFKKPFLFYSPATCVRPSSGAPSTQARAPCCATCVTLTRTAAVNAKSVHPQPQPQKAKGKARKGKSREEAALAGLCKGAVDN